MIARGQLPRVARRHLAALSFFVLLFQPNRWHELSAPGGKHLRLVPTWHLKLSNIYQHSQKVPTKFSSLAKIFCTYNFIPVSVSPPESFASGARCGTINTTCNYSLLSPGLDLRVLYRGERGGGIGLALVITCFLRASHVLSWQHKDSVASRWAAPDMARSPLFVSLTFAFTAI